MHTLNVIKKLLCTNRLGGRKCSEVNSCIAYYFIELADQNLIKCFKSIRHCTVNNNQRYIERIELKRL